MALREAGARLRGHVRTRGEGGVGGGGGGGSHDNGRALYDSMRDTLRRSAQLVDDDDDDDGDEEEEDPYEGDEGEAEVDEAEAKKENEHEEERCDGDKDQGHEDAVLMGEAPSRMEEVATNGVAHHMPHRHARGNGSSSRKNNSASKIGPIVLAERSSAGVAAADAAVAGTSVETTSRAGRTTGGVWPRRRINPLIPPRQQPRGPATAADNTERGGARAARRPKRHANLLSLSFSGRARPPLPRQQAPQHAHHQQQQHAADDAERQHAIHAADRAGSSWSAAAALQRQPSAPARTAAASTIYSAMRRRASPAVGGVRHADDDGCRRVGSSGSGALLAESRVDGDGHHDDDEAGSGFVGTGVAGVQVVAEEVEGAATTQQRPLALRTSSAPARTAVNLEGPPPVGVVVVGAPPGAASCAVREECRRLRAVLQRERWAHREAKRQVESLENALYHSQQAANGHSRKLRQLEERLAVVRVHDADIGVSLHLAREHFRAHEADLVQAVADGMLLLRLSPTDERYGRARLRFLSSQYELSASEGPQGGLTP